MLPYIPGSGGTGLGDFHPFMLIHLLSHRTKFPEPHHVWLCAGDGGGGDGGDKRNNALSSVSLKHLSGGTERQISPFTAQA